jgi:hypothetical protein
MLVAPIEEFVPPVCGGSASGKVPCGRCLEKASDEIPYQANSAGG